MERARGDVPRCGIVGFPGTGRHGARLRRLYLAAPGGGTGGGGDLLVRQSSGGTVACLDGGRRSVLRAHHSRSRDSAGSSVPDLEKLYAAEALQPKAVWVFDVALRAPTVGAHASTSVTVI